jgi:inhibitor of KinA sporulation pathway (predicted exonuclease)
MAPNLNDILVVDVESTCWDSHPPTGQVSEIIEIGICVLNTREGRIYDKRSILVNPLQSRISDFCTELTTITPQMAATGLTLDEAFETLQTQYLSHSRLWCSWGDYDRIMFETEAKRKYLEYPFGKSHLNVKTLFGLMKGRSKGPGMAKALQQIGLELEGTHHRGHDDAHNIARILRHLLRNQ